MGRTNPRHLPAPARPGITPPGISFCSRAWPHLRCLCEPCARGARRHRQTPARASPGCPSNRNACLCGNLPDAASCPAESTTAAHAAAHAWRRPVTPAAAGHPLPRLPGQALSRQALSRQTTARAAGEPGSSTDGSPSPVPAGASASDQVAKQLPGQREPALDGCEGAGAWCAPWESTTAATR